MKNFFKRNLTILLFFLAGICCFFLSPLFVLFLPIGLMLLAIPSAILAIKSKKKYNALKDYDPSTNIFDATTLHYDEEVYYIGTESEKNIQMKNAFSRFNALGPTIIFGFLSIALVIMAIMAFLNIQY